MRNHGLLTLGASIPAAFLRMYFLEHACAEQVAATSLNTELIPIDSKVLEDVNQRYGSFRANDDFGKLEWSAMIRLLERNGVQYKH